MRKLKLLSLFPFLSIALIVFNPRRTFAVIDAATNPQEKLLSNNIIKKQQNIHEGSKQQRALYYTAMINEKASSLMLRSRLMKTVEQAEDFSGGYKEMELHHPQQQSNNNKKTPSLWEIYKVSWIVIIVSLLFIFFGTIFYFLSGTSWKKNSKDQRSISSSYNISEETNPIKERKNSDRDSNIIIINKEEREPLSSVKNDGDVSPSFQEQQQRQWQYYYNLQIFYFFLFVCISNALRQMESGFVASNMVSIRDDLKLHYTDQGTIAASPDYGLAPGGFLAIWTFRFFTPKKVLNFIFFFTTLAYTIVALYPSFTTLVTVRAINGALWSHAATFYPVWIDQNGSNKKSRMLWMAWLNVSLLLGVLLGYGIGGAALSLPFLKELRWDNFYFIQAGIMGACFAVLQLFDHNFVDGSRSHRGSNKNRPILHEEKNSTNSKKDAQNERHYHSVSELFTSLFRSIPYVLSILINGALSGGVVFAMYFIDEIVKFLNHTGHEGILAILLIFVTAPAPGMLFGSWIVGSMGGYTNHTVSFGMTLVSSLLVLTSTISLTFLSGIIRDYNQNSISGDEPSSSQSTVYLLFLGASWLFFFAGAMPASVLNGVSVSVLPNASFMASAIQFGVANAAKIAVPQIGGYACEQMGLLEGYNSTLMITSVVFMILAFLGLFHATISQERS